MESVTNILYFYIVIKIIQSKYMEIPKELLEKWKVLRSQGDTKAIVDSMPDGQKVNPQTIRNAFNEGECNPEVFKAMAEFYTKRAESIAPYLRETISEGAQNSN